MKQKTLTKIAKVWCKSILFEISEKENRTELLTEDQMEYVLLESLRIADNITELPIRKNFEDIVNEYKQKDGEETKDGYLPEVCIGDKYEIDGEVYVLFDIRATNVDSPNDFIIACRFKSEKNFFEERIQNVIGNPEFKLID